MDGPLSPAGGGRRTPGQWQELLLEHGFRDMDHAMRVTVVEGGAQRQLAERLGVLAGDLEKRIQEIRRAQRRVERDEARPRSPGMYRTEEPGRTRTVATDGDRLRCEVCGRWYRSLAGHVRVHDMTADDYRAEHDLPVDASLISDDLREHKIAVGKALNADGTFAGLAPGPELDAFRRRSQKSRQEMAADYWRPKLAAHGWESWHDAAQWAEETGNGWREIAACLGVVWQSARTAAKRVGAEIRTPADFRMTEAAAYVAQHGSLDGAGGALGRFIREARSVSGEGRVRGYFDTLDALDPNWRIPLANRAAAATARGEYFETVGQKRRRELWEKRLGGAGWSSWSDALVWAAGERRGPDDIARRIGSDSTQVVRELKIVWSEGVAWRAEVRPFLRSVPGHMATDERGRFQCHVCGLWMRALTMHVQLHGLTKESYRAEFALDPQERIESRRPKLTRADDPDYWSPILEAAGFATLDSAVDWATRRGMKSRELAARLEVPDGHLVKAMRAAQLSFPAKKERMLAIARREVAAGRNLSAPSNHELKRWIMSQRSTLNAGGSISFEGELDGIDPHWRLSEQARCERNGTEFRSHSTRMADKRWADGLRRAGWATTAEALAWMHEIGGGPPALSIRMDMPQVQVWSRLSREGHEWVVAERSGGAYESQLKAACALAVRDGDLSGATEVLREWLGERSRATTVPWVNRMLDEFDPRWRDLAD